MAVSIEKASTNEYEEIIAFANQAFSFEKEQDQFQNLLAKLYQGHSQYAENHFLLRRDGELEGLLLCQPDTLKIAGYEIPFYKIGTVSVSSATRGLGHMERLLHYTNEFMKQNNAVFGVLGGLRHRYERFGFHPASCFFQASFTSATLAKEQNKLARNIFLSNLEDDSAWVEEALVLHSEQKIRCQREKSEFLPILKSWQCIPIAISNETEFLGYCCIKKQENSITVHEILLKDAKDALDVIKALYQQYPVNEIMVKLPISNVISDSILMNCDEYVFSPASSYHVLDFVGLLKPLIEIAVLQKNIADMNMSFMIDGKPLYIEICNRNVIVSNEISSSVSPISLSAAQATQIFFGPIGMLNQQSSIPAGIFPLPLFVPNQDCC